MKNVFKSPPDHHVIELSSAAEVEVIFKEEVKELERLSQSLKTSHQHSKTLHHATATKDLRSRMDADVALALKNAKVIKLKLEALERSNASNRSLPGSLKKKLKECMDSFNDVGQQEMTLHEIQERHDDDGMKELEKNLNELHQVFLDIMAVLVQCQGDQQLDDDDDIESHAKHQKNNFGESTCCAIIGLLVPILIAVLFIWFVVYFTTRPSMFKSSGGNNNNGSHPSPVQTNLLRTEPIPMTFPRHGVLGSVY